MGEENPGVMRDAGSVLVGWCTILHLHAPYIHPHSTSASFLFPSLSPASSSNMFVVSCFMLV